MSSPPAGFGSGPFGYGPFGIDEETPGPLPPGLHPLTVRLYQRLGPAAIQGDQAAGWPLLALVDALSTPGKAIDDLVRDTDTTVGWQMVIDPDTTPCPDWAAQWYGISRIPGESDAQLRARMRDRPNWRRGRPATIVAAVAATVPPGTLVTITERIGGDAYVYLVHIYAASVPDPVATQAAFDASRPAGFINSVLLIDPDPTWAELDTAFTSWSALDAAFASWSAMDAYIP